ncbi:MAG: hypothetical protein PHU21_11950, partial [Elusimicrobia bacterium]|nr:hypothetical protein [Elusimicrobiota bacterium]
MNIGFGFLVAGPWSWRRILVLLMQAMAIVLPIAFYLRTYDSCMIKISLVQMGTLAALTAWLLGIIQEGRLEFPARALPVLGPAVLLLLWNLLRFASAANRWASLHGFLQQECFLLAVIMTLAVFSRRDARQTFGVILASWSIVVLYGLLQRLGLDPFIWKGAFGARVFSTMGNPNFLAAFLLVCTPLALACVWDDGPPAKLRLAVAGSAVLACAVLGWTGSGLEIILGVAAMAFCAGISFLVLPERKRAAAAGLAALCAATALLCAGRGETVTGTPSHREYDLTSQAKFLPETWKGTWALNLTQPWLGSGPGSFWVRYPAFRRPG